MSKQRSLIAVAVVLLTCATSGMLSLGATAFADSQASSLPSTWHVHDCVAAPCVLPHAPVGFFPTILEESVAVYVADPAQCPDATDKAFLGGGQPPTTDGVDGNQPLREGVCMTSTRIIHLKSVPPNQPAPHGWTYLNTSGGKATYYSVTTVGSG